MKIYPVILSGGAGSRLWPLSRECFPKQLLPLTGERTLLQQTALRVSDQARFESLTVVANVEHRFVIAEQLREIRAVEPTLVLEPAARNTAAAVATAALIASRKQPDALILVMPADHHVGDDAGFLAAVEEGATAAADGALVLFGVRPDVPATGYGYIRSGDQVPGASIRTVAAFVEKPDRATAQAYLAAGDYLWNSGIFLMSARSVLLELERHEPAVVAAARQALASAREDMDFLRLDPAAFALCPTISFDYAVMERTDRAAVVPVDFGWTDVGSWSALWELAAQDSDGNAVQGDVVVEASTGSYLRSEGPLIAAIGVENLVVVATPDAVLVAHKSSDQAVKTVVERLHARNHPAAVQTRRVHRPWGWYEQLHTGDRFQVKRITVEPGQCLSLQKHFHRSEHWVVVQGTALVSVDGGERLVRENESVYIPQGAVHRLTNPGKVRLALIEVQSGSYLGEDDIVRLEDAYARA